ncbi:CAP domain-containing protein [Levilactobacillus tongjiangensis]|uniref:CAP domain-containing protein n=1 Tax=Levilactobacillus tongjiangensis TaxID=2486023 RepID=A0ABW1SQ13_9LACO|nr:CAP domain-containing protein [Levilactobacillus tongjiangensis]
MKAKKMMISALTVLSVAAMGLTTMTSGSNTALAKSKAAKVLKTTTYKSKHKVHVTGGWMYSSTKLTKKTKHMTKCLYTKFYATKKVTVRQANGKKVTYNYLKSKNGKTKGYVSSTYVYNKWGHGKYSVTAYRKAFVKKLNEFRAKDGAKPVKENAKLDKIAQKNADRMRKEGKSFEGKVEGTPHAGWIQDNYTSSKQDPILGFENGTQWGQGMAFSWMRITDRWRDIGAIPHLMNPAQTKVGVGGMQHGQELYEFVLLSHNN